MTASLDDAVLAFERKKGAMTMTTDFTFTLPDQPGTGARVLDALGQAGINVVGACAVPQDG
jgi:hypothetical protein